jgi:hypothetical protein
MIVDDLFYSVDSSKVSIILKEGLWERGRGRYLSASRLVICRPLTPPKPSPNSTGTTWETH